MKMSCNNKAWSTRKTETWRNTVIVEAIKNPAAYEIQEVMVQMITELVLVLKHVSGGVEKINTVNYFTRSPPPIKEYYYTEDEYVVNDQTGVF